MKRMMVYKLFTQAGLGQTQREFETGPFRTQLSDFKATTDPAALRRARLRCLAGQSDGDLIPHPQAQERKQGDQYRLEFKKRRLA
jgi:hypothetical protein